MGADEVTEIQISDAPLQTVRLERFEAEDEDDAAAAEELVAATFELARGWLEPLGVGVRLESPDRHVFLRRANLPADVHVQTPLSGADEQTVAELDARAIASVVAGATLGEVRWTVVRARLPVGDDVEIRDGQNMVPSRIEERGGERWATGPIGGPQQPPIMARAMNDHGVTSISLFIYWSAWVDHPALVAAGVERVLARGRDWQVV